MKKIFLTLFLCLVLVSGAYGSGFMGGSSGSGDVAGPASSTDNAIARFHLTTGKILQNGLVTIDDDGTIRAPGAVISGPLNIGATGVNISTDNDGALTFTGNSAGYDEDLTWNFDDVENTVGVSSSTGVTLIDFGINITIKSGGFDIHKDSGVAGEHCLAEANSTDLDKVCERGPDSLAYSHGVKTPTAKPSDVDQVRVTTGAESGTGATNDIYLRDTTYTYRGAALTPVIDDPDNFAANFTGANLYGGTFIANAAGTAALPDPAVGMNFTVVLETAEDVTLASLATGTADTIVMNGLAAEADEDIIGTTVGAMCVFQYRAANSWMATCNGFLEVTPP